MHADRRVVNLGDFKFSANSHEIPRDILPALGTLISSEAEGSKSGHSEFYGDRQHAQ